MYLCALSLPYRKLCSLYGKDAPLGLHCGGLEECRFATRRRQRVSQEKLFLYVL